MLVLSRQVGEKIFIGEDIVVTVVAIEGGRIRLAIDAPRRVAILREELREASHPPNSNPEAPVRPVLELPLPDEDLPTSQSQAG